MTKLLIVSRCSACPFFEDKRTIPDDCPLRQDDWTITVTGGN